MLMYLHSLQPIQGLLGFESSVSSDSGEGFSAGSSLDSRGRKKNQTSCAPVAPPSEAEDDFTDANVSMTCSGIVPVSGDTDGPTPTTADVLTGAFAFSLMRRRFGAEERSSVA